MAVITQIFSLNKSKTVKILLWIKMSRVFVNTEIGGGDGVRKHEFAKFSLSLHILLPNIIHYFGSGISFNIDLSIIWH